MASSLESTVRVNHIRRGAGEPLVLIHGIGHRWQAWLPVLDRLSAYHDVFALDLPGFGDSPVPGAGMPADMPATVALIAEWVAAQGVGRPHVAGNSLGGAICLELAAAGLARSATVFSPAGFATPAEGRRALAILAMLRANTFFPEVVIRQTLRSGAFRTLCYASLLGDPPRLEYERAVGDALALRRGRGFIRAARALRDYRFAGAPDVPVTIAWGAKDRILAPHQAERARALLPQARHVALPSCGHVPISDNPDLVADLILETAHEASVEGP